MSCSGIWNCGKSDPLPRWCLFLFAPWCRITATAKKETRKQNRDVSGSLSPADLRSAQKDCGRLRIHLGAPSQARRLTIRLRNPCQSRLEPQLAVGGRVFTSEPAELQPVMIMKNECVRVRHCVEPRPRITRASSAACKCVLVQLLQSFRQTHTRTHTAPDLEMQFFFNAFPLY